MPSKYDCKSAKKDMEDFFKKNGDVAKIRLILDHILDDDCKGCRRHYRGYMRDLHRVRGESARKPKRHELQAADEPSPDDGEGFLFDKRIYNY